MDGLLPDGAREAGAQTGAADLSLKTISEDTSPVVKLVHSTVYDALRASVSDIHLAAAPGEHRAPARQAAAPRVRRCVPGAGRAHGQRCRGPDDAGGHAALRPG
jgi:hypothetical protein